MTDIQEMIRVAETARMKAHDAETKVGCAIFDTKGKFVNGGANTLLPHTPEGPDDDAAFYTRRPQKYQWIPHAEIRALLRAGREAQGGTLVSTWHLCLPCAHAAILAGIRHVVCVDEPDPERREKYSFDKADEVLKAHGIRVTYYQPQVTREA